MKLLLWIGMYVRRISARVRELNVRIERGHELRDRANQNGQTVDGAFWVYLR